jgi:hypothetical protein
VANQRRLIGEGAVDGIRMKLLGDANVTWNDQTARRDTRQAAWDRMFDALQAFQRSTGHLRVPRARTSEPSLPAWIATQRFLRKTGMLAKEREVRLQSLGFEWDRPATDEPHGGVRVRSWERMVNVLRAYQQKHGDCAVPARWPGDRKLAQWVVNQRSLKKQGRLDRARIEALDRLGFLWSAEQRRASALDRRWEDLFATLGAFVKRHGHSNVPLGWSADPRLAAWGSRQRHDHRRGVMRPDRLRRLASIRFDWTPVESKAAGRSKSWETMFGALKSFIKTHGHATVPEKPRDRGLFRWIASQRRLQQKGRLPTDRRRRLEEAGISWTSREQKWEAKFAELQAFRRLHGNCDVPMEARKGGALARWISAQRADYKKGRLALSRISRLQKIGFVWDGAARKADTTHALAR